jgi:stearoyl-CoA desaturase (delta-9 desaturase)
MINVGGLLRRASAITAVAQRLPVGEQNAPALRFSPQHLAFVLPLVLLHIGCGLIYVVGASPAAAATCVLASTVQIFGITVGYHRLLSHRSFKTSRAFQFFLAVCGVFAGQNGPLWWVSHHRNHHQHSDRAGDTHSPRAGFFWSHMGWLLSPRCVRIRKHLVADLARFPELQWLERYFYLVVLAYWLFLYALGESWQRLEPAAGTSGTQLVVWGGLMSTVCVYHIIWSGNSVCHRYGTRRFPTRDDSRNNLVVSLFTLGDGWHHNHHYCPYSARHGFRWWEIDINYVVLRLLARFGIVWDLKLPPERVRH